MLGTEDKWEVYKDKREEFRWRRKAPNGKITGASCEGYVKRADCLKNAQRHNMDGNPDRLGSKDKWDIYKDRRGNFRWRRKATNGEVTGASSEGYASEEDAKSNALRNGLS